MALLYKTVNFLDEQSSIPFQHKLFNNVSHAILIIGKGYEIRCLAHHRLGIVHGYTKSGIANHRKVIEAITTGNNFIATDTNLP